MAALVKPWAVSPRTWSIFGSPQNIDPFMIFRWFMVIFPQPKTIKDVYPSSRVGMITSNYLWFYASMMFDVQVVSWNCNRPDGDAQRPSGRISGFPRSHTTFLMEFREGLAETRKSREGAHMSQRRG